MSEPVNTPPASTGGLLDDIEQALPYPVEEEVAREAGRDKQQYDHVAKDPDELIQDNPNEVPEETGRVGLQARRKAAGALMLMLDRAQAGVFTLFGAKGHSEDFRFNREDRKEMENYLLEGLPEDFQLPWYIPFLLLFITQLGVNYARLQEIKEERKAAQEKAKEEQRQKEREEQAQAELEELRQRREGRRDRRSHQPPPPVPPEQVAQQHGEDLCPECGTNPLPKGRVYCSTSCRSKANGRKSKARK